MEAELKLPGMKLIVRLVGSIHQEELELELELELEELPWLWSFEDVVGIGGGRTGGFGAAMAMVVEDVVGHRRRKNRRIWSCHGYGA
jgi:hypothetical protein